MSISDREPEHAIHVTGEDDLLCLCWKTLALEDAGHAVVWVHEGREYRRTGGHDARQD